MSTCPHCHNTENQTKAGFNRSGSQRMLCKLCRHRYTPEPRDAGYPDTLRQEAVAMYVDGTNFRAIARRLKVNHQTVINWVNAYAAGIAEKPPIPDGPFATAELDELFTFVGEKKRELTS